MRASRKLGIIATVLVLALGGAGLYYASAKKSSQSPSQNVLSRQNYRDAGTGVQLEYPEEVKSQPVSDAHKKANIIFRLKEQQGRPPTLITLRSESGLRRVAALTRSTIIDTVVGNSERAFPQRFKGYHKETSRRFEQNGRKASEIIFTYDSPVPGQRIKQRFVVLVKDDDMAVYLAMQSTELDFEQQNQQVFNAIADSLKF